LPEAAGLPFGNPLKCRRRLRNHDKYLALYIVSFLAIFLRAAIFIQVFIGLIFIFPPFLNISTPEANFPACKE
jgi:hypothetical protein